MRAACAESLRAQHPAAMTREAATTAATASPKVEQELQAEQLVLTSKLATRLLAELLEAYSLAEHSVDNVQQAVGCRWGFASAAEMTRCIEDQANASYACVPESCH